MKHRRLAVGVLASMLVLSLAACSSGDTNSTTGSTDKIKIGIKFDQPGLGLKQGDQYIGMDVDVARYVAEKLGYSDSQIEWTQAPSAQRETLIENGQVKLIAGTYSITDKRKEKVDFAGPYFIAGQDLLVRSDDQSITGPESLTGKKLCSVTGSTSAQNVKKEYPGVDLQEFGTYSECAAALAAGRIDALTTDDTILAGYAAQEQYKGKLRVVGKPFSVERYGVGLKKGDTAFCQKVTDALKEMISDGTWQKLVDTHLGPANFKPGADNPPTPDACS